MFQSASKRILTSGRRYYYANDKTVASLKNLKKISDSGTINTLYGVTKTVVDIRNNGFEKDGGIVDKIHQSIDLTSVNVEDPDKIDRTIEATQQILNDQRVKNLKKKWDDEVLRLSKIFGGD